MRQMSFSRAALAAAMLPLLCTACDLFPFLRPPAALTIPIDPGSILLVLVNQSGVAVSANARFLSSGSEVRSTTRHLAPQGIDSSIEALPTLTDTLSVEARETLPRAAKPNDLLLKKTLTVGTDFKGGDTVTIIIPAPTTNPPVMENVPPVPDAGAAQFILSGSMFQLNGNKSSDPDHDTLTFHWTQLSGPAVTLNNPNSSTPTAIAPRVAPGGSVVLTFQLDVNDGNGHTGTAQVTITILGPGAIVVTASAAPDPLAAGSTATLTANISGGIAPYTVQWSVTPPSGKAAGVFASSTSNPARWTSPAGQIGTWSFGVGVQDAQGNTGQAGTTLLVSNDCNTNGTIDSAELTGHDCNTNQILDVCDLASALDHDCNTNGLPDLCDLAASSVNCNTNAVPDVCERAGHDCNNNGTLDLCELSGRDCNTNGTLDQCELAGHDCNNNGTLDVCELSGRDCNTDGTLDQCQLAAHDCNSNGTLDACELSGRDCNTNGMPDPCELAAHDCNTNQTVDACEPPGNDCNSNATPDVCEMAAHDCDSDGTLDACELSGHDCNSNGTLDQCESSAGDCNDNGTFDACELSGHDCNTNGTLDTCDTSVGSSVDCNTDQIPDVCQLAVDCNTNGVPDVCDAAGGDTAGAGGPPPGKGFPRHFSADCNTNGTPDECEPDCNTNGYPDVCDVYNLDSYDCDTNNTPDECQSFTDCNSNGTPDTCDLALGGTFDCNTDGTIDACEALADCDSNGTPDVCDLSPFGQALEFNGGQFVHATFINVSETDYTASLWFKTSDGDAGLFSVDNGFLGSNGIDRNIYLAGGDLAARVWNDETIRTAGQNFADGQWHQVVHVFGGAVGGQRLYVDGVLRAGGLKSQSDFNWQSGVNIGFANDSVHQFLTGRIDEVRIWRRALSTSEILANYQTIAPPATVDLQAWYRFDEPAGSQVVLDFGTTYRANIVTLGWDTSSESYDPARVASDIPALRNVDCNTNGTLDACELAGNDCNTNGTPDACDAAGTGTLPLGLVGLPPRTDDCNTNGTPDECELAVDCNTNGVPDACDAAGIGSPPPDQGLPRPRTDDCNTNGTPDECELAGHDCNTNRVLDACEMFADCNSNGTPDVCELAAHDCDADGTLDACEMFVDCNSNGTPDVCELAAHDCDADGTLDACELSGQDCNSNGTLDQCEMLGGDCNDNGTPDVCELSGHDCNANGTLDQCEMLGDCNDNGTPDVCELSGHDCNTNGTLDACELAGHDCNSNGTPDACELSGHDCDTNGTPDVCERDCNTNATPDACEAFVDCNSNGIPDACDLRAGAPDCNTNGVPDVCDLLRLAQVLSQPPDQRKAYAAEAASPPGFAGASAAAPFLVNVDMHVARIKLWGIYFFNNVPNPADDFTVIIHPNNAGVPGPALMRLDHVPSARSATGGSVIGFFTEYEFVLVPQSAIHLTPGTYFVEIFNHSVSGTQFLWETGHFDGVHGVNAVAFDNNGSPGANWSIDANFTLAVELDVLVPNDCNTNGTPDVCDLSGGAGDCNTDGTLDACAGFADCNTNGTPDVCDLSGGAGDCNSNGTLDACELSGHDCDTNGTLDVCEPDCNTNATADACELAGHDCNTNGIPDACDLRAGAPDCNTNGLPDVCDLMRLAQVLNQPPDQRKAYAAETASPPGFAGASAAAPFLVDVDQHVTQIKLWGIYFFNNVPNPADDFTVIIHPNNAGVPGPVLTRLDHVPSTRTATGGSVIGFFTEYEFVLVPQTAIHLTPGSYFVEIFNHSVSGTQFLWETGHFDGVHGVNALAFDNSGSPGANWLIDASYTLATELDVLVPNDCDTNGVPDACEPDANTNGTPDACEAIP